MEYPINLYTSQLKDKYVESHQRIANLSENYLWSELIEELKEKKNLINSSRLPDENGPAPKLLTPLHQAANGKAPKDVFETLLGLGASKSLKTADGETAYAIGKRVGLSGDILKLIEVPADILQKEQEILKLEEGLHKLIKKREKSLIKKNGQQLPQLAFLYEFGSFWYMVPGMYGGFAVSKHEKGIQSESMCRVVGGSGQRHVIDREGNIELVEEGFV